MDVDMRPTRNVIVRVAGSLDTVTGLLTWRFLSLDPATGFPSEDPDQGFLPPNTAPPGRRRRRLLRRRPEGRADLRARVSKQGHDRLRSRSADRHAGMAQHDRRDAALEPGRAAAGEFLLRDRRHLVGVRRALGRIELRPLRFARTAGRGSSGARTTMGRRAVYLGHPGHTYAFYSIARDAAGNEEAAPAPPTPRPPPRTRAPSSSCSTRLPARRPAIERRPRRQRIPRRARPLGRRRLRHRCRGDRPADGQRHRSRPSRPELLHDVTATNTGGLRLDVPEGLVRGFPRRRSGPSLPPLRREHPPQGRHGGMQQLRELLPERIPVTRAQMAVFLLKSKYGAAYAPPPATGTSFPTCRARTRSRRWIEQLATEAHHGRLRQRQLLPEQPGHARPDGRLPAQVEVRAESRAAAGDGRLRGRAGVEPLRAVDRDARAEEITGGCGGRTTARTTPSREDRWRCSSRRPSVT